MGLRVLPLELHHLILAHYVTMSRQDLVAYTYGLTTVPQSSTERYIKAPVADYQSRWDAVQSIRQVNRSWHSWALDFALQDVHIIVGRREKWFDVTANRGMRDFKVNRSPLTLMQRNIVSTSSSNILKVCCQPLERCHV